MYLSTSCYNANDEWYGFNHHQSEKQFIISQRELATIFVLVCYHREAIHEPSVVYFVISISLDALFNVYIRIVVVFGDFVTIYYALCVHVRHNKLTSNTGSTLLIQMYCHVKQYIKPCVDSCIYSFVII